ncbi:ORF3 [Anelloviridae sp.]|nr:ORF3 [Anelloviridae sp.]
MMLITAFFYSTKATGNGEDTLQILPRESTSTQNQTRNRLPTAPTPVCSDLRYQLGTLQRWGSAPSIPGTSTDTGKSHKKNGKNSLNSLLQTLYMRLSTQDYAQKEKSHGKKKKINHPQEKTRRSSRPRKRTCRDSSEDSSGDCDTDTSSDF